MNFLEFFTVFDWISPLVNTARDIHHAVTDGETLTTIWLDKYQMSYAERELQRCGIDTISEAAVAFDPVAGLRVRESEYDEARTILNGCGIQVYQ